MTIAQDPDRLREARQLALHTLLDWREPGGWWQGSLSSSALSTATAISALCITNCSHHADLVAAGLRWLEHTQNSDGGWGDTPDSPSNVPTSLLVLAAAGLANATGHMVNRVEAYVTRTAGRTPQERAATVASLYGADRTFSVPILTNLALAGQADWRDIPRLPFELACLPHACLNVLPLRVVSYALPALVAIGHLLHRRSPSPVPPLRWIRHLATGPALRKLIEIQPASGGFLEAVPLTSFVVMSLGASVGPDHPVVTRGLDFLYRAARSDGSWPIDTDLSCWLTSQAALVLASSDVGLGVDLRPTTRWLLQCQHDGTHPYTAAAPGGWAWTHRPGGVPDADDTAGALLVLDRFRNGQTHRAAACGVGWLLDLQNTDGGWPTFCRGWGRLPFDRSAPDLCAHVLRALVRWRHAARRGRLENACRRGLQYLQRAQALDGSWTPLWFGNQRTPDQANPVLGTARVLTAYRDLGRMGAAPAKRGVQYLLATQHPCGAWGGAGGIEPTVEETALAIDALTGWAAAPRVAGRCARAGRWLADRILTGGLDQPAPIGVYFARLWYAERLYPVLWSLAALGRLVGQDVREPQIVGICPGQLIHDSHC